MSWDVGLLNVSVMKRPSWKFHWWSWLMRVALRACSEDKVLKLASKVKLGPLGLRLSMKRDMRWFLASPMLANGTDTG
jgi:hypothetical protein